MLDCGHEATPTEHTGGYAITPDDRKVCYHCADWMQLQDLKTEMKTTLYLSENGRQITTWSGGEMMRTIYVIPRRMPRRTYSIRAVDPFGCHWFGIGIGKGGYVTLRRVKAR